MSNELPSKGLAILLIGLPIACLLFWNPDTASLWSQTVYNWLHVPTFACVTIGLHCLIADGKTSVQRTLAAAAMSLLIATSTELLQIPTARSASWVDFGANVLGIVIGLLGASHRSSSGHRFSRPQLMATLLLALSMLPLIRVGGLLMERTQRLPTLVTSDWPTHVEMVVRRPTAVEYRNLSPDWRGYRALQIRLSQRSDRSVLIMVRVHDAAHRSGAQPHSDRFNRRFVLPPGESVLSLSLDEIAAAPASRTMNLARIDGLVLFSNSLADWEQVEIHDIRLSE